MKTIRRFFSKNNFQNINYKYQILMDSALRDISLVLEAGQSIGLVGPSGSGKTTLVDFRST